MINTLFSYRVKEDIDLIDVTNEAVVDYHSGKHNMLCNQKKSRQPKKKRLIKQIDK